MDGTATAENAATEREKPPGPRDVVILTSVLVATNVLEAGCTFFEWPRFNSGQELAMLQDWV